MGITEILRASKNALLPAGRRFRRLPIGPAAGCVVSIDFHHQLRLYLGLYEAELLPHFRALVSPGSKAFDLGGREGYDALLIAKRSGGGRVLSVECEHAAAEEMRETFRRNPFPIEVVEKFVCDRDDAEHVTLDTLARETFTPDFIKMDIEGAEADALRGATGLLGGPRPALIIEVHGAEVEAQCLEILRGHNYQVTIVDQRGWLQEVRPIAHNRWLVCRG